MINMENNFYDLDTRKLLSLEGQKWSHIDFGIDDDSSSNDVEDAKSDTSSTTLPSTNGINYNSYGFSDTMKLKEEDMYLFGICPAYDPFFLAVCEYCGQVIKPQALAKHIEQRHRSFPSDFNHAKAVNSTEDLPSDSCNAQSSLTVPGIKGISNRVGSNGDASRFGDVISSNFSTAGRSLFSSDNKNDSNRNILLETIPPGPGPGSSSSSPLPFGQPNLSTSGMIGASLSGGHLKTPSSLPGQSGTNSPFNNILALGSNSSAASSPSSSNSSQTVGHGNLLNNSRFGLQQINSTKTELGGVFSTSGTAIGSNGAKSKSSNNLLVKKASIRGKLLPCKDREYDPDKHCGVKFGDMDKPCTRSLTCKTHSLTLRRSVVDRSKNFDDLLAEHRAAKEAALRAAGIEVKPTKQQLKQRELEAKRQLLLQQQQQKSQLQLQQQQQKQQQQQLLQHQQLQQQQSHLIQAQHKQQKQQHQPILMQQKLDHQNSHHQKQPKLQQHHLRHHSTHLQDSPLPVTSTLQQPKEINPAASLQYNQNSITVKQDKPSPILARKLIESNQTDNSKTGIKSSKTTTGSGTIPITTTSIPSTSTSSPTPMFTYSTNRLDKTNFIEVNGCLYLPNPPKPMALCNFNARQISIEPLNCDQDDNSCNLSSRLFTRKRDLTYSALTIFRTQSKTDGSSRPNNQKLLSLLNSN